MKQLAQGLDTAVLTDLGAFLTALFFVAFTYWIWWAFRPAHREQMEAARLMPFQGDSHE